MKNLKFIYSIIVLSFVFTSCSNDDDVPVPVNEEEIITTVIATLVAEGSTVTLTSRDLDGDGPDEADVTVSGDFQVGLTYVGSVQFLNETENPAEDITEEVEEEAEEHQVFFLLSAGLDGTINYGNNDGDGNPLGTQFSLLPNAAGNGNFAIILRHEPKKPNDGTLDDAGGETDVIVTFQVTFEE
ncbi:MAG TPA: type 1 periplasmic binding fold superfamily protein [Flavobacteriaceae bacterium]|jgi:hypothetical protein|nr:type 1 periplasmic binding fold superfamily protein [Flavobacteriaceae bacterium]MAM27502.1 type 1 periplasmic binding fold superfamily protein [Flavobacteriaceae bacterium]HBR54101.1 type 1 periplasmic binding fold superfamily protein [Flavobacteriaceae bacterium]